MGVTMDWLAPLHNPRVLLLECPVLFVPVEMRQTGMRGAEDGEGKEAYA
jgi:hypothetical protein